MFKSIADWFYKQRGFWFLVIINGFLWSWLFLIDAALLSHSIAVGYLIISLVFIGIVSSTSIIFYYAIAYLLKNAHVDKPARVIIIKIFFVWAFVEFFASRFLAATSMGRNGSWDTILPFSSLTPYIMLTPLKFLSRFTGYFGLSSIVITGIFTSFLPKLRRYLLVYCGVIILLTIFGWVLYAKPNGAQVEVTIVAEKLDSRTQILAGNSKFVLLPEYGLDGFTTNNIASRFKANQKVAFVGSAQEPTRQGFNNTLIYGTNNDGYLVSEQKNRLIPGGEYLPLPLEVFLKTLVPNSYTNFQVTREVIKGHQPLKPFHIDQSFIVGSAACSSIVTPEDYRNLTAQGATVLTNSASLEVFKGSRLFYWQHHGLAEFMAVANARPMLQSSNNWQAFALDLNGNQLASINPVSSKQVEIRTNSRRTLYTKFGEWVAYVGGIWLIIDAISGWQKARTKRLKNQPISKAKPL